MKTLEAKYIPGLESLSDDSLREALASCAAHHIDCVNWKEFPYAPSVSFHVCFSDSSVAVLFEVCEDHVRAEALEDNGPVWEDSCVEFFIMSSDGKHYVNFEMNCIGTLLAARRTSRHDPEHFGPSEMGRIRHFTSLPHQKTDIVAEGQSWWAVEVIPFEILGYSGKPSELRANLYKCGDKCEKVHFLSWSEIELESPDFHCPDYFGKIVLG